MNHRQAQVIGQIVGADAAGGDEFDADIRAANRFERLDAAGRFGREEFEKVQPFGQRLIDVGGGHHAGGDRHVVGQTPIDDGGIKAGGDDEFGAGRFGLLSPVQPSTPSLHQPKYQGVPRSFFG